jgi:hypothetical protein
MSSLVNENREYMGENVQVQAGSVYVTGFQTPPGSIPNKHTRHSAIGTRGETKDGLNLSYWGICRDPLRFVPRNLTFPLQVHRSVSGVVYAHSGHIPMWSKLLHHSGHRPRAPDQPDWPPLVGIRPFRQHRAHHHASRVGPDPVPLIQATPPHAAFPIRPSALIGRLRDYGEVTRPSGFG